MNTAKTVWGAARTQGVVGSGTRTRFGGVLQTCVSAPRREKKGTRFCSETTRVYPILPISQKKGCWITGLTDHRNINGCWIAQNRVPHAGTISYHLWQVVFFSTGWYDFVPIYPNCWDDFRSIIANTVRIAGTISYGLSLVQTYTERFRTIIAGTIPTNQL